jgi:hypothetical protein
LQQVGLAFCGKLADDAVRHLAANCQGLQYLDF